MLVYGRQEYQEPLGTLLQALLRRAACTHADCLDELRTLLIQTGQLEQGIDDYQESGKPVDAELVRYIHRLTEQVARLFLNAWAGSTSGQAVSPARGSWSLGALCAGLRPLQGPHREALTIKIPEGFEYYALFPEQYCLAAQQWAAAHAGTAPKRVVVLGIRSIGTSLSALVAAVLEGQGWEVQRRTVRPTGHPFAREVSLKGASLAPSPCAVVVDEGPGLSGSSMAAAARALAELGIGNVAFLPGHGGAPGSGASAETRRCWAETPRFVATLADLRWGGLDLSQALVARSREWGQENGARAPEKNRNGSEAVRKAVEDLSGGRWRQRAFASDTPWPAAWTRFERAKYWCANGNGHAVLWKFGGLGCAWQGGQTGLERAREQTAMRAHSGWVPETLGSFRGFVATPWIEGTRLGRSDVKDTAVMAHVGRYLCESAGVSQSTQEAQEALTRLKEMLVVNTREALGEATAEKVHRWAERMAVPDSPAAYGDGRMALHEWVRTSDGRLLKTDPSGHDLDHTLVGKQPLLWDVAGCLVEWGLEAKVAAPLLCPLASMKMPMDADTLRFYQMAYATFRLGMTTVCLGELMPTDEERHRLEAAAGLYRRRLEQLLLEFPA